MKSRNLSLIVVVVAAVLGGAVGAGVYAGINNSSSQTTTVVQNSTSGGAPAKLANGTGLSVNGIYDRVAQGVVKIDAVGQQTTDSFFGQQTQQSEAIGSGIVYDKSGDIVTNEHVVSGGSTFSVTFADGRTYNATVVGSDPANDLAVVHVEAPASELQPLTFANSSDTTVGDNVVAIGTQFGLQGTVTSGIISALHRTMTSPDGYTIADAIQTDAAINHGSSGGPLLDSLGRVIGVNAQIESNGDGNEGVAFAIPSNTVTSIAGQIISGKQIQHAYLGVTLNDSSNDVAGALLVTVVPNAPADKGGLQQGDIVTKFNGAPIADREDLAAAIDQKQPGDKVTITYNRLGKTGTATITLGVRPATSQ